MDLSPEILQSTSRLELYARKVVDGFMSGGNRSIRAGMGMEFKQFRNYQPGDDIRQFDWKMYARSGRYYIRESEVSSDVSIHILLDGSASMGFAYDRWNKFDYCKVITLLLTYMALRQGDEVTIHILKDSALQAFEIRSISRFPHLVNGLIGLKPGGQGGAKFVPQKCYNKTKKMCFLISDFYQDNKQEVDRLVDQLTVLSSETIAFHALSSAEEKLDYNGEVIFKDLETGAAVHTNPQRIRQEYMSRYAAFIRETREKMLKKGVYYHSLYMEQHVLETLELFLKYRDKMK